MAEIKSESVADFIPESVAGLLRNQQVIEAIRGEGTTSLRGIAEELNRRGILTGRGGGWYATTVKNLIDRGTKTGDK